MPTSTAHRKTPPSFGQGGISRHRKQMREILLSTAAGGTRDRLGLYRRERVWIVTFQTQLVPTRHAEWILRTTATMTEWSFSIHTRRKHDATVLYVLPVSPTNTKTTKKQNKKYKKQRCTKRRTKASQLLTLLLRSMILLVLYVHNFCRLQALSHAVRMETNFKTFTTPRSPGERGNQNRECKLQH